jgi:MtaA/CmuA family methyltransferase
MDTRFAQAQIEAGADIIGIGDAAASLVGPAIYDQFIWPYEKKLVDAIRSMGAKTRLHICGNTTAILASIGRLGCDMIDLDYPAAVGAARQAMGPDQVLLGNLDPVRIVRNGTPQSITAALHQCHLQAGPKFIVGAGCEIPRDTKPQNMEALTAYAKSHAASPPPCTQQDISSTN